MKFKACIVIAAIAFSVGCGKGTLPTVNVTAKVLVDDKPFGPATLSMSPPNADGKLPNASGAVAADGVASLKTFPNKKGIVAGSYVCNLLPDPLAMNQVPLVSPVSVQIKDEGQTVEFRFTTIKNAVPGMVPPTTDGGAPATATLAPL